ncbi:hypothetical protein CaCOL14_000065 [Colletotrichum acutatum]|uniref:Methyltransferase domain-containing protein n=1 Tax=Glomerella acutata TaxID=27357 RepID=A0AAD8XGQ1_GLOAC|nr:uncharacterized protein BDZ83DRAFT_628307 [Colletotrichum acutatum]KAK1722730.1 hypothetical protein BDZ83DRAFT_628307 [Colletotrichum acutatum]
MTSDPRIKAATVLNGKDQAHAPETLIHNFTPRVFRNTANYTVEHIKIASQESTGLRKTRNRMRLVLIHNALLMLLNNRLPVIHIEGDDGPGRILDVGTGTGIWAIDFGDQYPKSKVIGTDFSPV